MAGIRADASPASTEEATSARAFGMDLAVGESADSVFGDGFPLGFVAALSLGREC